MESKHGRGARPPILKAVLLIEPVWNRNLLSPLMQQRLRQMPFNRTSMESKPVIGHEWYKDRCF